MSILIMILIAKTILFKVKYKISGFRVDPSLNKLNSKILKEQIGLAP